MAKYTFTSTNFPQNPNSNPGLIQNVNHQNFNTMVSNGIDDHYFNFTTPFPQNSLPLLNDPSPSIAIGDANFTDVERQKGGVPEKFKADKKNKIAFRTKSTLEFMDDGFKWRKYGKKTLKNNPYPRNYFKCSNRGCNVKKRVERDKDDSSYVITTYEGLHNHESPSIMYCSDETINPGVWTLKMKTSTSYV